MCQPSNRRLAASNVSRGMVIDLRMLLPAGVAPPNDDEPCIFKDGPGWRLLDLADKYKCAVLFQPGIIKQLYNENRSNETIAEINSYREAISGHIRASG